MISLQSQNTGYGPLRLSGYAKGIHHILQKLLDLSTLSRGCRGVGLIWKKDLDAVPISSISSDRICVLRIKLHHTTSEITVLGVYLPCSDMGMECYSEHLVELENLISESERLGPIVIIGDFNAHLGKLGGVRGQGNPNQQGTLPHQLLVWCKLYAVSLSSISRGPLYTFWNSTTQTTVDYAIASQDASDYIQHCFTHESSPLNNSDHLPISELLHVPIATATPLETPATPKVNWAKALRSNQLLAYQRQVSSIVNPLLGKSYRSPVELNVEICSVSQQLCSAALPQCTAFERKKKCYKDQILAQLTLRKKAAWDDWAANGRPDVGLPSSRC